MITAVEKFQALLRKHNQYEPEAYNFIYEAIDYADRNIVNKNQKRRNGHISGYQLLEGARLCAIEQFGYLAKTVLNEWGVKSTNDLSEIVFNLVEHNLLKIRKNDRKENFDNIYDFNEVFDLVPIFIYSREKDEWQVKYVTRKQYTEKPNYEVPF